jgi:hypothetical protein
MTFTSDTIITASLTSHAVLPFSSTNDSGYSTATCLIGYDVSSGSTLDVDVFNATTTTILGSVSIPGPADGVTTFTFTIPVANAILNFRSQLTGTSATIYGARAKFT